MPNNKEKCIRCGLPKSEWKGRWQDPLCKVGKTTYELHTIESLKQEKWEEEFDELLKDYLITITDSFINSEPIEIVKSFIKSTIQKEREEIVEKIKEGKFRVLRYGAVDLDQRGTYIHEEDIINLIKDNK